MPKVSVLKCVDYHKAKKEIEKTIKLLGGVRKFFRRGETVLLKPNISDSLPPEKASTTHPLFVKAVIEIAKKAGAEVWVGEGSGGNVEGITRRCLDASGIGEVIEETGVEFKNFQEGAFVQKSIPNHKVLEKTDFASAVFQADVLVNLPKLKTHGLTFMTGSIKNCFGCIHPLERQYLHRISPDRRDFADGLVDVYSIVKPALTIMDAVIGMEGDEGPSFGNPKKIGLVVGGEDGVAVDAVAAAVTGHNPLAIPLIKSADSRRVGVGDLGRIKVIGNRIEDVAVKDFKQHPLFDNRYRKMRGFGVSFVMVPELTESRCIKCGTCMKNCPVNAISMAPYPVIDRKRCIMCYCCQEMCPEGAYKIRIEWLERRK